ncbi:hypothetical protein GIB67_039930 [Kingdonia uniflora]|uniref:Fructose-1-6-bisphosphatase class 1 C-terminal domain-containing protein n=1 Tax=Kingdonia uniflora TaxID=39325 RepID=A0A7J7P3F0_9MAGN|nr:hypothetical protein GIB67_039930 [Kingdonia uniflora]
MADRYGNISNNGDGVQELSEADVWGVIIVKEKGVFTNVISSSAKAKLRLLFEMAPLGLLVEKAGGYSSDGYKSILDKVITALDEQTQVAYGSKKRLSGLRKLCTGRPDSKLVSRFISSGCGPVAVSGKLESGALRCGSKPCTVAMAGDNVAVGLQGIDVSNVVAGGVLSPKFPCGSVNSFRVEDPHFRSYNANPYWLSGSFAWTRMNGLPKSLQKVRSLHFLCEGVGKTLKGRDLSKVKNVVNTVRNAIFTRIGFIEQTTFT